ncbi:MAG: hypothetical protein Q8N88_05320 [Nanoarchaeota archaeon]|nr:hypothetical protein [Nanoarchaeota archaeon]
MQMDSGRERRMGKEEPVVTLIKMFYGYKVYSQASPDTGQVNYYENKFVSRGDNYELQERHFPNEFTKFNEISATTDLNIVLEKLSEKGRNEGKSLAKKLEAEFVDKTR